jgi:hypothetical protein
LIEADFRREYGIRPAELARLGTREFLVLVGGLSADARWPATLQQTAHRVETPEAIAAIFGTYQG